jgi:hypothetical protein
MGIKVKDFKRYAEQEVDKSLPVKILPDNSLIYKNFRIKKVKEKWTVNYTKSSDIIDEFYTKTGALLGAKFYNTNNLSKFTAIKDLDRKYYYTLSEIDIYRELIKHTQDFTKKEILYSRYDVAEHRSKVYKEQIASEFKTHF